MVISNHNMKMTYISPNGQTVQASSDPHNIPQVNISNPSSDQQVSFPSLPSSGSKNYDLTKAEDFRKFIEVEVLKIIKKLAESGKTPKERIQELARRTLELIKPGMTIDQLYQAAVKLDDQHPELAPVVFAVIKEYEQKYEKRAIEQVSAFVRAGKYDEAEELVKKVLQFKISTS